MGLDDILNSEFIEEMDASHEQAERPFEEDQDKVDVKLWVEGTDDIPFWFAIFRRFAPNLKLEFDSYSFTTEDKEEQKKEGKHFLLSQIKQNPKWVGKTKIVCIDSDYDYLVSNTMHSKIIRCARKKRGPFIFQTYTYAIENYKCLAESLEFICVDATYNADRVFDFVEFLEKYSQIIYDLFVLSVYFKKFNPRKKNVCNKDSIGLGDFLNIENNGSKTLKKLNEKVKKLLKQLYSEENIDDEKLGKIKKELGQKGVTPQNVYLFINAHALFDAVIKPILKYITKKLASGYHKKMTKKMKEENIDNKTSGTIHQKYENEKIPAIMLLRANKAHFYLDCPMIKKIKQDIDEYLRVLST